MFAKFLLTSVCLVTMSIAASAQVTLNRGNDTDPSTLDHHRTSTVSENHVLVDLYDGLTILDAKGEAVPGVASSWEISDDGTLYTFHLRQDAKWSNGDPVTAGDFQFAFRRLMDPQTAAGYASLLFIIKNSEAVASGTMPAEELGVKAVDDHTLTITLNAPAPYFLELLTHQTGLPLHQKSVEQHGDRFTQPGNLVTNGAFMLESFTPNDKIVMQKNPHYYEADAVKIDTLNWIPFEDRASCMRRFEAGEVHICSDVPAEQMSYVRANLADSFRLAPYLGTYYLPVKGKTADSPLKDKRVRQAISLGIDRGAVTITIAHITFTICFAYVVVQSRLSGLDPSLEEAAIDLGCTPFWAFLKVALPNLLTALVSAWLLSFTLSLDDLVIASFTTGPAAQTLPMNIYAQIKLGVSPEINAISTLILGAVTFGLILVRLMTLRSGGSKGGIL